MKNSGTKLVIAGLALLVISCNNKAEKQPDSNKDSLQTEITNDKQPDNNSGKFDINSVPVSDKELGELTGFSNLKILGLGGDGITDEGVKWLDGLTTLEELGLGGRRIGQRGRRKPNGRKSKQQ